MKLNWYKRKNKVKLDLTYYGDGTLSDEEKSARFDVALAEFNAEFMMTYTPPSTFRMARNNLKQKMLRKRRLSDNASMLMSDILGVYDASHKGGKNMKLVWSSEHYDETVQELQTFSLEESFSNAARDGLVTLYRLFEDRRNKQQLKRVRVEDAAAATAARGHFSNVELPWERVGPPPT